MKYGKIKLALCVALMLCFSKKISATGENLQKLSSPDGKIQFMLYTTKNTGELFYSVLFEKKSVITDSRLGLIIERYPNWDQSMLIQDVLTTNHDTVWQPLYGEKDKIIDRYNQMTVKLALKDDANKRNLYFIIRVYNEGLAFRYFFPEESKTQTLNITSELTEFNFPKQTHAWFSGRSQGTYQNVPVNNWSAPSYMPLTLEYKSGLFASILEAEMVNYSVSKLVTSKNKPDCLHIHMTDNIIETPPFSTPWRVLMIAERPGELLENNHIVLNLNPPSKIENPWWVTPGKVIREWSLSANGAKECVDFAVAHNLQFIHFDAGWYGSENLVSSDATTVTVDPKRNPESDLDLHEAIKYAKSKGIKVFVYVNHRALEKQLDELLPLYKSWGIDGIKFGFVHTESHRWSVWLHEAIIKAAKYQMMVNVHDNYRPTGFSRTYPNLLTMEGIYGNEEMPDADHNTILPFTRFVAGRADYTICYYYRKEFGHETRHIKTSPTHQLALAAIYYSPLQYLFWYDAPSDYQGEPEIEFFANIPTVWDETTVVDGKIGEYAIVARRDGEDWFVGGITNNQSRTLEIPFSFLEDNQQYLVKIYTDGGKEIKTRTHVKIESVLINSQDKLKFDLISGGGVAMHLIPVNNHD